MCVWGGTSLKYKVERDERYAAEQSNLIGLGGGGVKNILLYVEQAQLGLKVLF